MDNATLATVLKNRRDTLRQRVSVEEWEAREDLAACYRLCVHYRMTDMIYNHISLRVPGTEDQFLINAFGLLYEEVSASNLVKVDIDAAPAIAARYDVRGVPSLLLFEEGELLTTMVGAKPKRQLLAALEPFLD